MSDQVTQESIFISDEEYWKIARELEAYGELFSTFWEIGEPEFTTFIPTACIQFDKEGHAARFLFNPDFWNSIDFYTRVFVICHEMLHIAFNHGIRIKDAKISEQKTINDCLDIIVNEALVKSFEFDKNRVNNSDDLCWLDTVFKGEKNIKPNKTYEYYYNKAKKKYGRAGSGQNTVDDHCSLSPEDADEIIRELNDSMSDEGKQEIKDMLNKYYEADSDEDQEAKGAGHGGDLGQWVILDSNKIRAKKKKKWETIINKWAARYKKQDIKPVEQWAREPRRFNGFLNQSSLMLPSDMDIEDIYDDIDRIEVYFFLDTSGSCVGYEERFFKAARSLPPDRFNIRLFCFNDKVYETSLESGRINKYGGTLGQPIEDKIQEIIKNEKVKYPHAVFLITDGQFFDRFVPAYPEKWYFFLVETYYRTSIPRGSKTFQLKDFE